MHQQVATNHFRIKRPLVKLCERDPALINLPVPLPSVPVVAPVAGSSPNPSPSASQPPVELDKRDPLINLSVSLPSIPIVASLIGGSSPSPRPSPSQSASQPATSSPPTSKENVNGKGKGKEKDKGGGESGVDSGGSTVPDTTGGSDSGGSSNGGDSGGNGTSGSIPANTSTTTSTTSSGGSAPTSPGAINAVPNLDTVENNESASFPTEGSVPVGSPSQSATGLASPQASGGSGSRSGGTNAQDPSATGGPGQANVSKHGLSSGGIAAIVVVLFILLIGLVVVILRRRNVARRSERRNKWFGGAVGYGSTRSFGSAFGIDSATGRTGAATVGSGTASARSSFATNFDHGLRFTADPSTPFDINALLPKLPAMAEINQNGPLINTGNNNANISRFSTGSDGSHTSQYLVVPGLLDQNTPPELATPMSVRPFSPSESFAFPKPPSGEWDRSGANVHSTPNENDWLNRSMPGSPGVDSGRALIPKQFHAMNSIANTHPMADPTNVDASPIQNPFVDPSLVAPNPDPGAEFAAVEVIRRPFAPTLSDELAVEPGESVRVAKVFDDGWAYVEKIGTDVEGLIPIDCMRNAGQDLPAFLAAKRVSSYYPMPEAQMGLVMGNAA